MIIELASLSPEAREHYRIRGERVTTSDAVAQAHKTMGAFRLFGVQVAEDGYGPEDHERLSDATDTLLERYTDRSEALDASKLSGITYHTARRGARQGRQSARTLFNTCIAPLRDTGKLQEVARIESLLKQTRAAPDDNALIDHLKRLHAMLNEPMLEPYVAGRGGASISARLQSSREAFMAAIRERAAHPDVAATSEDRNIIEGIIVVNCRNAYAAARIAARRLGQPAIANEFKLVYLRSSTRTTPVEDEPATGEPGTDEPETSE
jgi:hypothetical protein